MGLVAAYDLLAIKRFSSSCSFAVVTGYDAELVLVGKARVLVVGNLSQPAEGVFGLEDVSVVADDSKADAALFRLLEAPEKLDGVRYQDHSAA